MPALAQWLELARGGIGAARGLPTGNPDPLPGHVGLWLDRALIPRDSGAAPMRQRDSRDGERGRESKQAERDLLYRTAIAALQVNSPAVAAYRERFAMLRRDGMTGACRAFEVRATSRIHPHPATGATVTDGSLLLHHTYGVPYLPGSALKGICRARARRLHAQGFSPTDDEGRRPWYEELFGYVAERRPDEAVGNDREDGTAGLCDFWDALWIPVSPEPAQAEWSPLALDVVTPHHSDYYTPAPDAPHDGPLGWQDPIPTQFLTVRPGARFALVLETSPPAAHLVPWIVDNLLVPALAEDGIGAHTRAGYGRLALTARPSGSPDKTSASTASSATVVAEMPKAAVALVSFDRGRRTMTAQVEGGRPAVADGAAAERLLESLSEATRERLRRGRPVRLRVTWLPVGNGRRLESVQE